MCGRFTLHADPYFLEDYFQIENMSEVNLEKRYNIAPSQGIFCLVRGKKKLTRAGHLRWGLIPSWARDQSIGNKMINARSETLHEKRSFSPLLKKRHCVIVANSFYEWRKEEDGKQPYLIKHKSDEPFIFAGLWDRSVINNEEIVSCTMLTTEANASMKELHHRMPVILNKERMNDWLRTESLTDESLREIYASVASVELDMFKVPKLVNYVKNDSIECIQPLM